MITNVCMQYFNRGIGNLFERTVQHWPRDENRENFIHSSNKLVAIQTENSTYADSTHLWFLQRCQVNVTIVTVYFA